jgi:hypothetical protein
MDSIVPARKVLDGLELNISAHIPVRSLIFFLIGTWQAVKNYKQNFITFRPNVQSLSLLKSSIQ